MTSSSTSATPVQSGEKTKSKSLRKRLGLSKKKDDKRDDQTTTQEQANKDEVIEVTSRGAPSGTAAGEDRPSSRSSRKRVEDPNSTTDGSASEKNSGSKRTSRGSRMAEGVLKRVRSLSRSRSLRGNASDTDSGSDSERQRAQKTIVTVTSCRSDGYYNQKAPGSTSKLPRKAPTNLKLFHELAVGLKDAYAAVGQTPVKPETLEGEMSEKEFHGRTVLWEFIGNIDFVRLENELLSLNLLFKANSDESYTFSSFLTDFSCWRWLTKLLWIRPLVALSRTIPPSKD